MRVSALLLVLLSGYAAVATQITIPAQGAIGQCSSGPTTQATFLATVDAPGVKGIYLLPQDDYNSLLNASKSATPQNVQFQYFIQFSCATGNVTSCQKNTGTVVLPNNVTCVAFVNELNQTLNGDLTVDFGTSTPLSGAGGVQISVGLLYLAVSVAGYLTLTL